MWHTLMETEWLILREALYSVLDMVWNSGENDIKW
jgi:hypothetical protein